MLSWVILRDRLGDPEPFVFANTHFDHRGPLAREASARLIRERASMVASDHPIILVGDFNTTELLAPYEVFTRSGGEGVTFVDSYRVIHPVRMSQEASFSAWHGARDGERIDWILHTPQWMTLNARINYTQYDGKYPSDHYPVEAMLLLRSSFGNP
jgi:endonuclease/exonuclease/phosphatase family metal-dependent hydrolase